MTSLPVAVVSGASRGIGKAIAKELSTTHHIVVGGRDERSVLELTKSLPSAEPWVADVRDSKMIEKTLAHLHRVDVLVNAAGIWDSGAVASLDRTRWLEIFDINVFSVAEVTRVLLPALRATGGTVVMLNSVAGLSSRKDGAIYSGTKFALKTLTDVLREEERDNGVRVSSIHPGRVDTDMVRQILDREGTNYDSTHYLRPRAVAEAVRLVVDTPLGGAVESLSIRPMFKQS